MEDFDDWEEGDTIEAFNTVEKKRTLEEASASMVAAMEEAGINLQKNVQCGIKIGKFAFPDGQGKEKIIIDETAYEISGLHCSTGRIYKWGWPWHAIYF